MDFFLAILGTGGATTIAAAAIGWLKSRSEKPHVAPADQPTIGSAGLAQIGGMLLGQQTAADLIEGIETLAASHNRCAIAHEAETAARRARWEDRRQHEAHIAQQWHSDFRELCDHISTLNRRLQSQER